MKNPKNVSKSEQKAFLVQTLQYNSIALDYVKEEIQKYEDFLKWNELDTDIQERLSVFKYIEFTLTYLDDTYSKGLILLEG